MRRPGISDRRFTRRGAPRPRSPRLNAAIALLLTLVVAIVGFGSGQDPTSIAQSSGAATARSPLRAQAVVSIAAQQAPIRVPRSFLGISTEYWTIPVWAKHLSLLGHVLSSITPNSPMVLRIGGSSADQTFWAPKESPEWVFETSSAWLKQLRRIVNRFGVKVILDLNMVTATPQIAVQWARAAEAALPAESIIGFEIGNEGDIYSRASWQQTTHGTASTPLPQSMTARGYTSSFRVYAAALARVDRGIPLLGPALSEPAAHLSWIARLLAGSHPGLGAITVHRYPLSACSPPGARTFPTIARVLSENATAGMARTIRSSVRAATRAGLPLRLTEINSVTCGGRQGVSNTFATALWAPDALFELLNAGARSAAVHVRANAINMAFSLTRHGLVANPLFYGLAMFSRTLGAHPELIPLHLASRPSLHLKAWAVRVSPNRLHVLLINKGAKSASVSLQLPVTGRATVEQLLAHSPRATTGVTLAGQHLNAHGIWVGQRTIRMLYPAHNGYPLTVPAAAATLVTATLRPSAAL